LVDHGITLFTALWKAGKTTLAGALLRHSQAGGTFCGREVKASKILYVTEEHPDLWADRCELHELGDQISFLFQPFKTKPTEYEWLVFLDHVHEKIEKEGFNEVVFDTLSSLWPVREENNAGEVQAALMPLRKLTEKAAVALFHHLRKGDGKEATASRGSGALAAFVDIIVELRRLNPENHSDRRRVLSVYGRYPNPPEGLIIELNEDGDDYAVLGDKHKVEADGLTKVVVALLPLTPPGINIDQILEMWPSQPRPGKRRLGAVLVSKSGKEWHRCGTGKKGSPYTYWIPQSQ
jgi:hypothetical protein